MVVLLSRRSPGQPVPQDLSGGHDHTREASPGAQPARIWRDALTVPSSTSHNGGRVWPFESRRPGSLDEFLYSLSWSIGHCDEQSARFGSTDGLCETVKATEDWPSADQSPVLGGVVVQKSHLDNRFPRLRRHDRAIMAPASPTQKKSVGTD